MPQTTGDNEAPPPRPLLWIVRGEPDDAEVAAVTAVVAAVAAEVPPSPPAEAKTGWAGRAASLRPPLTHGPGAWRASALPR